MLNQKNVERLKDQALTEGLRRLCESERQATAGLLLYLGEMDARKLYAKAACSSMIGHCTQVLNMGEGEA